MEDTPGTEKKVDFLVFGGGGWIGEMVCRLLQEKGKSYAVSGSRLENRDAVEKDLDIYNPRRVINAAGRTGKPNVDWCEDHKADTLRSNVIGTLNLADICWGRGLHLTNLASGCIYYSQCEIYDEEEEPNFTGSYYSFTKATAEKCLGAYDNVLILRLRMPISDDLSPRSLVTKITRYPRVVNTVNSMSVLHDLLPCLVDMSDRGVTGIFNFCNPGYIKHNEILEMYREIIDPAFTWTNFTEEEQSKVLKAPRSNCLLSTDKLESLYPHLPEIHEAVRDCLQRIKQSGDLPRTGSQ